MLIRTLLFSALMHIIILNFANAQDTLSTIGKVSIAGPTAASLGKFGDFPVGYNTGTPQINIPLYTVKSGSLSLPIGLTYHASGLKVQEKASWVGAGWALDAGGVITRTVVGGPDDRGVSGYTNYTNGHYSDYGYANYQFIPGSSLAPVNGMNITSDDQGFEQGRKDGEPDLYFFNFAGHTGKFYFNDDRTPMIVPEVDMKITPDLNNANGGLGFEGFIITTSDGIRYYFGKTGKKTGDNPIEISIPSTLAEGPAYSNQAVSSWYLNKIVSADGMDSIVLTYTAEKYSYYTISMFPVTNVQAYQFLPTNVRDAYNVVKNFVQGVRLNQIVFKSGTVSFNRADLPRTDLSDWSGQSFVDGANVESYSLGNIQVAGTDGFCKTFKFSYGYFHDTNPLTVNSSTYGSYNIHSDAYRLRLDTLQEMSCGGGLSIPPYTFNYFSEFVPRNLSFGFDHWGFSNGVTTNLGVIPGYTLILRGEVTPEAGANRDATWPAMRGGALQKITYPTGGSTVFEFEAHNTYLDYPVYSKVLKASASIGFGQSGNSTGSFTTDNGQVLMSVDLSSSSTGGAAGNFQIKDPSLNIVVNISVAQGGTAHGTYILLGNTAYTYTFANSTPGTPNGASVTVNENLSHNVQNNVTVGGLRIKSISNYDGVSATPIVTNYAYNYGGSQSSGILYSRPVYVEPIRNDYYGLVYGAATPNGCVAPIIDATTPQAGTYYITGGSVTPLSTIQGNHIGYNEVHVTQTGNGSSVFRYYGSNVWDTYPSDVCTRIIDITTCSLSIPNFPIPPLPFEIGRGDLKYEGHFNEAGQILSDVSYSYNYANNSIQTPGIKFITVPGLYSSTTYTLQTFRKTKQQVVNTQYDVAGAVSNTTTTYFGSTFHHEATRKVATTSTSDSLVQNYKYAFDFRGGACDAAIPDSLPFYNTQMNNYLVRLNTNISTCPNSLDQWACRYDTLQDYRYNVATARQQYINYRRRFYSDPSSQLFTCQTNAFNAANTELKPILGLQALYINPIIEVAQYRNANLLHANFTRYDYVANPTNIPYPNKTQLINLQQPSSTFTNATVAGSGLTKDSRYTDENLYQFSAGNPQQVTPYSADTASYLWDYQNQYPIAKVMKAQASQIAHTSFEADGSGGWTIGSSLRDTISSAVTGRKSYVLGNGAISRSGLNPNQTYFVSYWTTNAGAYTIAGTISGFPKTGKKIGNWTYCEHSITGVSSITVSGTGSIDELRLYAQYALMSTYTYSPLMGMTTECDANNRVTYYSYDALGRLKVVKDQDGNVIKTINYHYTGGTIQ